MGWNRIFPHLSTFEGPHKASLDHRADLGEAFCEFGTWLPTFGFFYVSSTAFPTNVAKRIFFSVLSEARTPTLPVREEFYALGVGWTASVKQAIYQLITSERLDEHMPPLSLDRGIINEEDAL